MFITIQGVKLHYEVYGSGRDVLVLHGWGASIGAMHPIINQLSQNFRVIAPDLPGCGKSSDPNRPFTVNDYSKLILEFIREVGIENPILVGHSNGGRITLHLNGVYHLPVRKNILIDAAGIKAKPTLRRTMRQYSFKTVKTVLSFPLWKKQSESLLNRARRHYGSSDYNNATPVMRQTLVNLLSEDLTPILPDISAPTLLIWGEKDTATPLSDAKIMEANIPGSGLVVLKGASHYSYLDCPVQFSAVLNSFLKEDKE